MFIKPQGPQLTAEQAQALDDDFFTSRPLEFFASRITALIDSAEHGATKPDSELAAEFAAALGLDNPAGLLDVGRSDRQLQTALDAFVLRHHVAEALVRLYWVMTIGRRNKTNAQEPWCTWAALTDSPFENAALVKVTREHLRSEPGREQFVSLVVPGPVSAETVVPIEVMGNWLLHALRLLDRSDIDITAAHNKIKHGLAVRSRDDQRIDFITDPIEDASKIPESVANSPGTVNLVGTTSVDYLSRPSPRSRQGLEFTTLNLRPATLLAEAWMMTVTYGSMFHVAAAKYFTGRDDVELPTYPDVPAGPEPHPLLHGTVIGIRHPVTTPPGNSELSREFGVAFHETFIPMRIDYAGARDGVIVDG